MRTLPQSWCSRTTSHASHRWYMHAAGETRRCPGRYTAQPSDPFAGIDENTESDARRPAVS